VRVLVFLAVTSVAAVAWADDREDARKEFAAGQAADKQKDWQTALEHYLRANDLVPHPFAIFNIAVDYEKLGRLREAATWYQRYLEAAPDSPDRDKVQKTLAELKTRPASLSVHTLPDGARVTIDGARAGVTPFSTNLRGGAHHVVVDLNNQHDERDVELEFGEPADVTFTLGGTGGTLYVYGTPAGAYVAIDDITVGALPATTTVGPGTHHVRVTAYGYTTYETETQVNPGQTANVSVALPRALGTIDKPGPKVLVGYVIGAAGGVDLSGSGPLVMGEFGARVTRYELVLRLGRVSGQTGFDFIFRYALFDTVISPYLAAGYAYSNNVFGYAANAGLRWDISRNDRFGFALLADAGVRWYSGTDSMGNASSGLAYPLELTAEITYR
jgi:tetratricopeptide (TPR) repeat protein